MKQELNKNLTQRSTSNFHGSKSNSFSRSSSAANFHDSRSNSISRPNSKIQRRASSFEMSGLAEENKSCNFTIYSEASPYSNFSGKRNQYVNLGEITVVSNFADSSVTNDFDQSVLRESSEKEPHEDSSISNSNY